jgi:hypothetical protein
VSKSERDRQSNDIEREPEDLPLVAQIIRGVLTSQEGSDRGGVTENEAPPRLGERARSTAPADARRRLLQ